LLLLFCVLPPHPSFLLGTAFQRFDRALVGLTFVPQHAPAGQDA